MDKPATGSRSPATVAGSVRGAMSTGNAAVLLVEDERSISEPFAESLGREGFTVTVAETVAAARERFTESAPDVVLLDLTLPDGDGRDLCRWIRDRSDDVAILMITARGTEVDRIVGLELGADDYIVKPFSAGEVAARIRAVLRRSKPQPTTQQEVTIGGLRLDAGARRVWLDGTELDLRRKEFDLLARLRAEPGQAISRETLMSDVWDMNWFGSTKTLDVHVGWLRRKLGESAEAPRYLHTVRGVGFRFANDEELAP